MSKIEGLVQQLCPNGVKYRKLGEVCGCIRGMTYSKKDETQSPDGIKVLRANNISLKTNTLNFYDVKIVSNTVRVKEHQKLKEKDILICAASGSKKHIGKVAFIFENIDYTFGGFMAVLRSNEILSSRFLFHLLIGEGFSKYLESALNTTTINNLNSQIMNGFRIPIPPLPIQQEIVAILDKFTQLEAELEVELEAELEARRTQYEYYRNQLLTANDKGLMANGVKTEWKSKELQEVANYSKTRIAATELDSETYVGVDNLLQNKQGKTSSSYVPNNGNLTRFEIGDILIGNIRPYLKKIWWATNPGGTNGDVLVIRISDESKRILSSKFLHHLLSSDKFFEFNMKFAKGAKMPRGDKSSIMKYKIPIPSLVEQERIVGILDKFDALVNDISVGLPAEIAARRKQYEYYRGKLLNFKALTN